MCASCVLELALVHGKPEGYVNVRERDQRHSHEDHEPPSREWPFVRPAHRSAAAVGGSGHATVRLSLKMGQEPPLVAEPGLARPGEPVMN